MGWLLELLVEGIREMLSQFVIDMMTLVTDMFTELLSCDLSLFEELFSVVGDLYTNVMLPMGIALLLLICVWQLFKSMFGKAGVASEDPIELVCRTGISLFFIVVAKPLVDYILTVASTPYQWIAGTDIEVSSFSEYVSALEGLTGGLGIDSLNIAVLMLIMQFVVAWNYFKMLFVIAERYVLLGVFSYTAPLAFGTGGSKATNNILASWAKMFGGQIILILLNSWCLKMFLSGYGNLNASSYGFTKFFVATLCLVGFCKVHNKNIPYENVNNVLKAAKTEQLKVVIGCTSLKNSKRLQGTLEHIQDFSLGVNIIEQTCYPIGRACEKFNEDDYLYNLSFSDKCRDQGCITVSPDGIAYPCGNMCGMVPYRELGSVYESSLSEIIEKSKTKKDIAFIAEHGILPYVNYIKENNIPVELPEKTIDTCHMCYEIFRREKNLPYLKKIVENFKYDE